VIDADGGSGPHTRLSAGRLSREDYLRGALSPVGVKLLAVVRDQVRAGQEHVLSAGRLEDLAGFRRPFLLVRCAIGPCSCKWLIGRAVAGGRCLRVDDLTASTPAPIPLPGWVCPNACNASDYTRERAGLPFRSPSSARPSRGLRHGRQHARGGVRREEDIATQAVADYLGQAAGGRPPNPDPIPRLEEECRAWIHLNRGRRPTQARMAGKLGVQERTVQRWLTEAGLTWRGLTDPMLPPTNPT